MYEHSIGTVSFFTDNNAPRTVQYKKQILEFQSALTYDGNQVKRSENNFLDLGALPNSGTLTIRGRRVTTNDILTLESYAKSSTPQTLIYFGRTFTVAVLSVTEIPVPGGLPDFTMEVRIYHDT